MRLQTLAEVEHAIGGRPKKREGTERMTFYLPKADAEQLRLYAFDTDQSISQIVRALINPLLKQQ